MKEYGDWGWGLGIGDWAQSPIPMWKLTNDKKYYFNILN